MILFPPKPTLPVETFIVYILFYLFIFTNQDQCLLVKTSQILQSMPGDHHGGTARASRFFEFSPIYKTS